jgi:putative ABC transport system permease protein
MMRHRPGSTAVILLSLALGIGANTAIFSLVNAVLIQPLPYADPDQLYTLHQYIPQYKDVPSFPIRARDFAEWRRVQTPFSEFAALFPASFTLVGEGEPERLSGAGTSANFFSLLGVLPTQGRGFVAGEDEPGRDRVVVISHGLWLRKFGAAPEVIGKTLNLSGVPHEVVGILPPDFLFPTFKQLHPLMPFAPRIDVWKPLAFTEQQLNATGNFNYPVIGRLKNGITAEQARQQMDAISLRLGKETFPIRPETGTIELHADLTSMREIFAGNARRALLLLLGAVGFLLLIACVNVTNLLLARTAIRGREIGIRVAVGAGHRRIARQLLTESLLISSLGAAAGMFLAYVATRILIGIGPEQLPLAERVRIDQTVLLFTIAATLLTTVVFGWLPIRKASKHGLQATLQDATSRVSEGRDGRVFRKGLVALEVALSTTLLVVAGLLLHSYVQLMKVDKGFQVDQILSVELALPDERASLYDPLLERLSSVPGVISAGAINFLPLSTEAEQNPILLDGDDPQKLRVQRPVASVRVATPDYFRTMGIPLRAGRFFQAQEISNAVVISEELMRALWPTDQLNDTVGRHVRVGRYRHVIVGVVGEVKISGLDRRSLPQIYRTHTQHREGAMNLVLRTSQAPALLAPAVRTVIREVDARVAISAMKTMDEVVSASVAQRRFQLLLILLFAALALVLALVGIYGVISYSVARQTSEIGLRIAFGALPQQVLFSVFLQGLTPVLGGLAVGLATAIAAARFVQSLLFGVTPIDPISLAAVIIVIVLTSTAACYVPARRASRVDPMVAMRHE